MKLAFLGTVLAGLMVSGAAHGETVSVAVAANFTAVAEALAPLFTAETGHEVSYSFGATGQLYTQISQGAPFDVFLAADDERPILAVSEGHGVDGTVFSYALGALALYSTVLDVSAGEATLAQPFEKLAIANPEAAPYGRAAIETLEALGLYADIEARLVQGENITQTLQFVETGNAELGFVAASQVIGKDGVWLVPETLYSPIVQDAVLLTYGAENPAATAYLEFLGSEAAISVIEASGYRVP